MIRNLLKIRAKHKADEIDEEIRYDEMQLMLCRNINLIAAQQGRKNLKLNP